MKYGIPLVAAVATMASLMVGTGNEASAQIDPGNFEIKQNDEMVGVIFVPRRPDGACVYTEYWYLFESYRYPNAGTKMRTVRSSADAAEPDAALFDAVKAKRPNGHVVHVQVDEQRPACDG